MVTALEFLEPELIGSTGRVFSAYYKSYGFDVSDGDDDNFHAFYY